MQPVEECFGHFLESDERRSSMHGPAVASGVSCKMNEFKHSGPKLSPDGLNSLNE